MKSRAGKAIVISVIRDMTVSIRAAEIARGRSE